MKTKVLQALLVVGLSATASHAGPVNFGFETGDFTGWTVVNGGYSSADVVNSYFTQASTTFSAFEGKYFALLAAGAGNNVPNTVSQTFTLNAGQTISGAAGFFADDYLPYSDYGYATIVIGSGLTTLFSANIASVGGQNGTTGWVPWRYTASSSGSYTVTYGVSNGGDNSYASHAFFDGASVPDSASTIAMLGMAVSGLAFIRRKP